MTSPESSLFISVLLIAIAIALILYVIGYRISQRLWPTLFPNSVKQNYGLKTFELKIIHAELALLAFSLACFIAWPTLLFAIFVKTDSSILSLPVNTINSQISTTEVTSLILLCIYLLTIYLMYSLQKQYIRVTRFRKATRGFSGKYHHAHLAAPQADPTQQRQKVISDAEQEQQARQNLNAMLKEVNKRLEQEKANKEDSKHTLAPKPTVNPYFSLGPKAKSNKPKSSKNNVLKDKDSNEPGKNKK